ncbi:hypothetical protein AGLY_016760 [Aphis glycines]|uniref:Uncharacterized protein n=1 Tax=Aphis glycines TaxID=307491 RepID=A0A6G0SWU5_APHGL|nr:hypothetical protein AGLY_016760 [Aphis glycines]
MVTFRFRNHKLPKLTQRNGTSERYRPETRERTRINRTKRVLDRRKPSGVRSCPVKTVEPPEKHLRKRRSHPRKLIESDVLEKEPQSVTLSQANGKSTERWSNHPDKKYGKSSRIENFPDKSEYLTVACDFSEENVPNSTSSDAEQDEVTQQLLICPVTSEDFPEEILPYPRKICKRTDSDTDSKFELRQRFLDLRTEAFESTAIATVSTGKTRASDVLVPAIELEFALGANRRLSGWWTVGPEKYEVLRISDPDSGSGGKLQGSSVRRSYWRCLPGP